MLRSVNARRALAAAACVAAATLPVAASAAGAQDYPGGTTPTTLSGDVLSEQQTRGGVAGTDATRGAVAGNGTGTGTGTGGISLPVTGGDVAGLGIAGIVLVAGGAVLVRRARRAPSAA